MSAAALATALAGCAEVTVAHGRGAARVTALDAVTLQLMPGERVALVGPSGSGKTTLLHVLGGLVTPTRGAVVWRGHPLAPGAGARVGFVFQSAHLLPTFTAYENIAFVRRLAGRGGPPPPEPEALLTLVGLGAKADALPAELSGGEAQRVAIARAIATQPELLLCDEPTGHLDGDTSVRVLDLIDALQRELGFTLVIATHDADAASRAQRIVELHDGRIVSTAELA